MSKDEEKYQWDWTTQTFPVLDPHSKIKHQIIGDYVETYINVLMRNQKMPELGLSIVDGFCGGGIYNDAEGGYSFGSPLIALEAIQEAEVFNNIGRNKPRKIRSQFHFVDVNRKYLDCLGAVLANRGHGARIGGDVFLYNDRFTNALPSVANSLKLFGRGERALFLLDQYSYKDVPMPSIKWIFDNLKNAEVLLTFNVDFLTTYLSDHVANRKAMSNIGLEKHVPWGDINRLKVESPLEWEYVIQKYLSEGIRVESGARFMTVFFIRPLGVNTMAYWFIHLANNYRANEVMKTLHWKYGNNFSHMLSPSCFYGYDANRDVEVTMQPDMLVGDECHFDVSTDRRIHDELAELLPRQIFEVESRPFRSLMADLTNFTMADELRVKKALNTAIANGDLVAFDKKKGTKRRKGISVKSDDILVSAPQKIFFFVPGDKKV